MILFEEHIMIRDMARDFACKELMPHSAKWDKESKLPMDVLHQMGALGLMGMTIPEKWGGEPEQITYPMLLL
jgi:alkylation response protein AidB-like acyl-CoA dehydrogenase